MRLDKFLCISSVGTRKKVVQYIYEGKVTVNDIVCKTPATQIDPNNHTIKYNGTIQQITLKYYILNKPHGCITSHTSSEKTVFDCLKGIDTTSLFAVGRLDKDTQGLLIITNDGELCDRLMYPTFKVEKTYKFLALGDITNEKIFALENGVDIGFDELTKKAKFSLIKKGRYKELALELCPDFLIEPKKFDQRENAFIGELTIEEGKKHQVKKMISSVDCHIVFLKRLSIGNLTLPQNLKLGDFIEIKKEDCDKI